jgi:chromosome segregation ATPase
MSTIEAITDTASQPSPTANPQPSKLAQLEQLLKQGKVLLQDLRTRLEETTKERDQLAATLKDRDASHEKLWTEQADMHRAESERHERELAELRTQLDEAVARRQTLAEKLSESEAHRSTLEKALATAIDEFEQLRTDADRAAAIARELFGQNK